MTSLAKVEVKTAEFQPAAVGTAETTALFSVRKGDVLLYAYMVRSILAAATTTSTISLGLTGSVAKYVAATDTESGAVGDIVAGVTANYPEVFTADDTIDADYIIGATPGTTNPKVRFTIVILATANA